MRASAVKGDVIAIPINQGWALGRVIFVSQIFKDIMYIEFQGPFLSNNEAWGSGQTVLSAYTAAIAFEKRGWKKVGVTEVLDAEQAKTIRLVADQVWEQDNLLRRATRDDKRMFPMMLVDGFIRVEQKLATLFKKMTST